MQLSHLLNNFAVYGYFITTCLVPIHWLPKLFFLLLWLTSGRSLLNYPFYKRLSPLIVIIIYMYGGVLGGLNGTLDAISVGLIVGVIPFLAFYPIAASGANVSNVIQVTGVGVSLYVLVKYLNDVENIAIPVLDSWLVFVDKHSSLAITEKNYFGETATYISSGAAPILFIAFSLSIIEIINKKTYFLAPIAVLNVFSIMTSGSRALWFTSFLLLCLVLVKSVKRNFFKIAVAVFCLLFVFYLNNLFRITELLSKSDFSNLVKITWIQSYLTHADVESVLFGGGVGVEITNTYFGITAIQTEITLLESIRMFGILFATILFGAVLVPSLDSRVYNGKSLPIAVFFIYIIYSFTNPVLFNGIGALVTIWYWDEICAGVCVDQVKCPR